MAGSTAMTSSLVKDEIEVIAMLDAFDIKHLKVSTKPLLFIDLEGINLSRDGSISLIEILHLPGKHVYLVDVHTLGSKAFTATSKDGNTIKEILESKQISKAIFDVRNDSDALFAHYNIKLAGINDVQLMELGARRGNKARVLGLFDCIAYHCPMQAAERQDWLATKEGGAKLFNPNKGGRYGVFNDRPLSPVIWKYCVQDVTLLPKLYDLYSAKLSKAWRRKVDKETIKRIQWSHAKERRSDGSWKTLGPW